MWNDGAVYSISVFKSGQDNKSNDKKKEEGGGSYMIPGPIPEPLYAPPLRKVWITWENVRPQDV